MSVRIWKFPIEITDRQEVLMPEGAEILSVGKQYDGLVLWAIVDPGAQKKPRYIEVIGTGNPFKHTNHHRFIGTVLDQRGSIQLVWHVFQVVEKPLNR